MPPKPKIKKEDIIKVSLDIIKKEGIEAINARRIAHELNCSVQPVFSNFKNMEDLKNELVQKMIEVFISYLHAKGPTSVPYKNMGMNYIRFARNEPEFYKVLFMSDQCQMLYHMANTDDPYFQEIEQGMKYSIDIDSKEAVDFHIHMWYLTHGIASLIATNAITLSDEQVKNILEKQFIMMTLLEEKKK